MLNDGELVSVRKAADLLGGVSVRSVYEWLQQGQIQKTKVGRRTMIKLADLEVFLSKCNRERK